jgi:ubiquinone/menaquinone biosynthesis C-methylase UbiE
LNTINKYYSHRAKEYEAIYERDDPVRQKEQLLIQNELKQIFVNKSVLEIACGTGYWTKSIAEVADKVLAIDYSSEVLEIAKLKNLAAEFIIDDAYKLEKVKKNLNAGCANFWLSHIPKSSIADFLKIFHSKLEKGSTVFMADNIFIEGLYGELIHKSGDDNTYRLRTLNDGSSYEIIKNYYTKEELKDLFKNFSTGFEIKFGNCFWWIKYKAC